MCKAVVTLEVLVIFMSIGFGGSPDQFASLPLLFTVTLAVLLDT